MIKVLEPGLKSPELQREYQRALNGQPELLLISLILENSSLYLGEMCKAVHEMTGLEVSASTSCRVTMHRHGLMHLYENTTSS